MSRPLTAMAVTAAVLAAGCGQSIDVPRNERTAADIFNDRCGGCHSLKVAATQGTNAPGHVKYKERTDGPNFNTRKEDAQDVLFAIRNGGFSGAIMPANIVVGQDAAKVATFVCMYAGQHKPRPASQCMLPPEVVAGTGAPPPPGQAKPSTGNAPRATKPVGPPSRAPGGGGSTTP